MATKTISVDLEAYARLREARRTDDESFSQVIKRMIPKRISVDEWLASIEPLSDEAIAAVEQVVAQRRAPHNVSTPGRASGARTGPGSRKKDRKRGAA